MNELIRILQLQVEKYKILKLHTEKQKDLLTKIDNENFHQTVYELEHLMSELKILEKTRQKELQDQDNNMTTDDKIKIEYLTKRLNQLAKDIKKTNACNEMLLNKKMEFIQFNINVMTKATADIPYQARGNISNKSANKINMFDQSI